jgi:hypothetical protein
MFGLGDPHPLRKRKAKGKDKSKNKRAEAVLQAMQFRRKAAMNAAPDGYKGLAARDYGTL